MLNNKYLKIKYIKLTKMESVMKTTTLRLLLCCLLCSSTTNQLKPTNRDNDIESGGNPRSHHSFVISHIFYKGFFMEDGKFL